MQHSNLLVVACRIYFPDQGSNLGPLQWECGVSATDHLRSPCIILFNLCVLVPIKVSSRTVGTCPCRLTQPLCPGKPDSAWSHLRDWFNERFIGSLNGIGSISRRGKWHEWNHPHSPAAGSGLVSPLRWDDSCTKLTCQGRRLIRRCGPITLHPGHFHQREVLSMSDTYILSKWQKENMENQALALGVSAWCNTSYLH